MAQGQIWTLLESSSGHFPALRLIRGGFQASPGSPSVHVHLRFLLWLRNEEESKGIESTSTETTPYVAVEAAGVTIEEHSDRSTVNEEADRTVGDGHHRARCVHPVVESGSIVLQVSNNMSEGKKRR